MKQNSVAEQKSHSPPVESLYKKAGLYGRTYSAFFVTHSIPVTSASGYHSAIPTEFRFLQ